MTENDRGVVKRKTLFTAIKTEMAGFGRCDRSRLEGKRNFFLN